MTPEWLNSNQYPFAPKYLSLPNAQMHYIDEGSGEVILFVHGTPSWSYEFRDAIRILSRNYRCIAMDHIGFGLSDKPADYSYTLYKHKENLMSLIAHLQLSQFNLLVHDFGGPIGLSVATSMPEKINKIIMANTWCFSVADEPEFKRMKAILGSPLLPFLYRNFNFSARYIIPAAFGERTRLTPEIHAQYMKPFAKRSSRNGTIGFAKSLLKDQAWFENVYRQIGVLVNKPALLLWGLKDNFITEKYLHRMQEIFPNAEVVQYADAGHFVFEEKGSVAAVAIERFLA